MVRTSFILKTLGILTAAILIATIVQGILFGESTHFLFPLIDTKFTKGFSEEKFESIEKGMTKEQVKDILGEPFNVLPKVDDGRGFSDHFVIYECWSYSQDNAFLLFDFSWQWYRVCFSEDGLVRATPIMVLYD